MKPSDMKILQHIRTNARENLTTISRKTGIPVSTIFDRLKSHEQQFVIKFTALVDFAKLGYPLRANICLKVAPDSRDGVKSYLLAHNRVNNLQRINNGFDYAKGFKPNNGFYECDPSSVVTLHGDYGKGETLADVGKTLSDLP